MEQTGDDFVGIGEIAQMAGVSRQAVANWRVRVSDFPAPITELASGPIFHRSHIRSWLRKNKRNIPVAHVISTINLKGGVAKTTTSVALAEVFSGVMGKKVLVIDLDPQTNATIMLLGEDKWLELNNKGHTLAQLFKDAMNTEGKKFNLEATLQKGVGDVQEARSIDLLPSSLDLIDVQDQLASAPAGKFYAVNPVELLWRAVKAKIDDYDIVIVDCPPNLGIVTLNGLRLSDFYLIPTIPDHLSTYGIPQIVTRIDEFAEELGDQITPLGIVATKFQTNSTVHNTVLNQLRNDDRLPAVYATRIKQTNVASAAAEHLSSKRTLRQKYGPDPHGLTSTYIELAREIWRDLEGEL
ncbi:AAA family ATPase [Lysobacter enzymogenes]|uniref:AAA family ATPase n=1 Tax=Lysobacter enzymogenes TaxID=69 RepID=UPI001A968D19|nr:AAA family ATPase [Lysobacter enzymogenes]QQP95000.1 AAA family ATPase [Lysobacter enzymogenes]